MLTVEVLRETRRVVIGCEVRPAAEWSCDQQGSAWLHESCEFLNSFDGVDDVFEDFGAHDAIEQLIFRDIVEIADEVQLVEVKGSGMQSSLITGTIVLGDILGLVDQVLAELLISTLACTDIENRLSGGNCCKGPAEPDISGFEVFEAFNHDIDLRVIRRSFRLCAAVDVRRISSARGIRFGGTAYRRVCEAGSWR